jgi:hypothetical protein
MADLDRDIEAYCELQASLESKETGRWAVIHDAQLAGIFDSFEEAATDAVERFGRGPYLIRHIGAPPITLPASAMFRL